MVRSIAPVVPRAGWRACVESSTPARGRDIPPRRQSCTNANGACTASFATHGCYPRPATAHATPPPKAENPAICRLSLQADEGIRTLDLRHGKATLQPAELHPQGSLILASAA